MFSTSTSIMDMASRHSGSIKRWKSKSTTSNFAIDPSTPLRQRENRPLRERSTNTMNTSSTANNTTTFLPELNSTPPMPTFQKPSVPSPSKYTTTGGAENVTPARALSKRPDSEVLPPISDPGRLLSNPSGCTKVGPAFVERFEDTPPLPNGWTAQHDRAICVLDARNYALQAIVTKVRRTFPGLRGVLTPGMVDKRLRQLDQDVEIDYWRIGLQGTRNAVKAPEIGKRMDSGTELSEPTVKATASGSLIKSPSVSNMLPDTAAVLASTAEPSQVNVTRQFHTGYRTQVV